MRHGWLLPALALALGTTGCFGGKTTRSTGWLDQLRPGGPTGPNAVYIEYAVIERNYADAKLDREVWTDADEQVIDAEKRVPAEANGFRVGRFGNVLPGSLHAMLKNPGGDLGHRQRRLYADAEFRLAPGKEIAKGELVLAGFDMAGETRIPFTDGEFTLCIVPKLDGDNRITLEFTPEMHSVEKKGWLPPGTALGLWNNKNTTKFEQVSWKLTLTPNEHIMVGVNRTKEDGLAARLLTGGEGKDRKQRVILLKAGRLEADSKNELTIGKDPRPKLATNNLVNQVGVPAAKPKPE